MLSSLAPALQNATGVEYPSPQAIGHLHAELKQAQQLLSEANAEVSTLQTQRNELHKALQAADITAAKATAENSHNQRVLKVTQANIAFITQERDTFKGIVALMEREAEQSAADGGDNPTSLQDALSQVTQCKERIGAAEELTTVMRAQLDDLRSQLTDVSASESAQQQRADSAEAAVKALEREIEDMGKEMGKLQVGAAG